MKRCAAASSAVYSTTCQPGRQVTAMLRPVASAAGSASATRVSSQLHGVLPSQGRNSLMCNSYRVLIPSPRLRGEKEEPPRLSSMPTQVRRAYLVVGHQLAAAAA